MDLDLEIKLQSPNFIMQGIHFGSASSQQIRDTKCCVCTSEAWEWLSVTSKSPFHRLFEDFKLVCFYFSVAAVSCI